MPSASLPTTLRGWIVALLASIVGFIAGYAATGWGLRMLG
jgi:hypothetical protein